MKINDANFYGYARRKFTYEHITNEGTIEETRIGFILGDVYTLYQGSKEAVQENILLSTITRAFLNSHKVIDVEVFAEMLEKCVDEFDSHNYVVQFYDFLDEKYVIVASSCGGYSNSTIYNIKSEKEN